MWFCQEVICDLMKVENFANECFDLRPSRYRMVDVCAVKFLATLRKERPHGHFASKKAVAAGGGVLGSRLHSRPPSR